MERTNNLETITNIIEENISDKIRSFYQEVFLNDFDLRSQIYTEMGEWCTEKKLRVFDLDLTQLILYTIEMGVTSSTNIDQALSNYLESRRTQKKYRFRLIKEELEIDGHKPTKRNKRLVTAEAENYFFLKQVGSPVIQENFNTKEEYIRFRYEYIKKWFENRASYLIDFTYFRSLQVRSQAKDFLIDLACDVLTYIKEEMYGSLEGYLTSLPTNIFDAPFFGYRQEKVHPITSIQDGQIEVVDEYAYDGNIIQTVIKSISYDKNKGVDPEVLSEKLVEDFTINKNSKILDSKDLQLLANVCSNITASVLNEDSLTISLQTLCKQFYRKKTIRTREYIDTLKRLERLSEYTLKASRHTDSGFEKMIIHFFDIHYHIPTESGPNKNIDEEIIEFLKDETITGFDYSDAVIQFNIGKSIKDSWRENQIQRVYSKLYNQIESQESKAKAFLFILEGERLRIYPEGELTLPYSFFLNKLRFSSENLSKIKKEIGKNLDSLKDQHILLEDYVLKKTGVSLKFYPFSQTERMVYRINEPQEIENNS